MTCRTCRTGSTGSTGSTDQKCACDGCHEHTPANTQAKHREEGVTENLQNCVRCHRSASREPEGKGHGERGKAERGKFQREKD